MRKTPEYDVNKRLDYIQVSTDSFTPMDDLFGKYELIRPLQRNYDTAKKYRIGVVVQWHSVRKVMRNNIIISGTTLANMRETGMTDGDILAWIDSMPARKYSRIDLAVTSEKRDGTIHGFLPHAVNYMATNGMCDTKLKTDNPVADPNLIVQTAYVGSRKSRNRIFRAYDKGIELGKEANKIIRYELETRKNATHIAEELHTKQTDIAAIIRRYVDFPQSEDWLTIMSDEIADNYRIDDDRPQHIIDDEKLRKRMDWLLNSVAPAMAKTAHEMSSGWNDEFWDKFSKHVAHKYNELIDTYQE